MKREDLLAFILTTLIIISCLLAVGCLIAFYPIIPIMIYFLI